MKLSLTRNMRRVFYALFVFFLAAVFVRLFLFPTVRPLAMFDYPGRFAAAAQNYGLYVTTRINLIPFKDIMHWLVQLKNNTTNADIIFYNLCYPIVFSTICGFFGYMLPQEKRSQKIFLQFVVVMCGIFLARLLLTIGFFDVDKLMLCALGFMLGYQLTRLLVQKAQHFAAPRRTGGYPVNVR